MTPSLVHSSVAVRAPKTGDGHFGASAQQSRVGINLTNADGVKINVEGDFSAGTSVYGMRMANTEAFLPAKPGLTITVLLVARRHWILAATLVMLAISCVQRNFVILQAAYL